MTNQTQGPAASRWPFIASLPALNKPAPRAVAAPVAGGSGETSSGPSVPAKVLLQNIAMVSRGGFYRKGTKAHARASGDLRALASAIIAVGC